MQKIKLIIGVFAFSVTGILMTRAVAASVLSIQTLPSYITTNSFKLSCTSDGGAVQFSYSKNGGAFTDFGPSIDTSSNPCVVQVDSSVVNDQTSYLFAANGVQSNSTFYDISGPSPVSNYSKQRIDDGTYKLQWTNPGDSDFDKVVIYRGDAFGFAADASHEIARVSGGANSAMSYDDHFSPNPNTTHYYLIRALDHAGNSSSLVGDGGTTTTVTTQGTPKPSSGSVTVLPKEQGSGSVLGTEATPSTQPESTPASQATTGFSLFTWITGHKKISLGVALVLIVAGYLLFKKKRS